MPASEIIPIVIAIIAALVSVFTLTTSATKNGFEQLRAVVEEQKIQIAELREENKTLRARIETLENENAELRLENDDLKNRRGGLARR